MEMTLEVCDGYCRESRSIMVRQSDDESVFLKLEAEGTFPLTALWKPWTGRRVSIHPFASFSCHPRPKSTEYSLERTGELGPVKPNDHWGFSHCHTPSIVIKATTRL